MLGLNPYVWLGGALALAAAVGGGYAAGDSAGANRVIARDAKAMTKAVAAMEKGRAAIDAQAARLAEASRDQGTETRDIYHETTRIIAGSTVYRNRCVDAAGVGLLDRAADNANRGLDPGAPAGDAAGTAEDAPER